MENDKKSPCIPAKEESRSVQRRLAAQREQPAPDFSERHPVLSQAEVNTLLQGVNMANELDPLPVPCQTCGSTDGVPLVRYPQEDQRGFTSHIGWHRCVPSCDGLPKCQPCPACSAKPKPEAAGVMTRGQIEEIRRGRIAYGDGGGDMVKLCDTALSLYDRAEAAERKLAAIMGVLE